MKKGLAVLLALVMVFSLAACGGAEPIGCEGKYISVAASAMGMTMTGEDAAGMVLVLEPGGKGTCSVEGAESKLKWSLDGSKMTLSIGGEDIVGDYSKDVIECRDFLGMGVDYVFAIEGSAAADPSNFMAEEEKQFVGKWYSYEVTDVLGDPMPEADAFGLVMELKKDHSASVSYEGAALTGGGAWSVWSNFGSFDEDLDCKGEAATVTFEMMDDGKHVELTFDCGDIYAIYTLGTEAEAKAAKESAPPAPPAPPAQPATEPAPTEDDTYPIRFYAVACLKDGDEYDCIGEYVEFTDEENGVVCFGENVYDITYVWYDDDSFEFTDEEGDTFEGIFTEDDTGMRLVGTYFGYEYVYKYAYYPVRYQATYCAMGEEEFDCDADYVEFTDSGVGVVSFNGDLYDITWNWYDDDSFDFTDEEGDSFEGYNWGNALIGTYFGYDYIYELVD